MAPFRALPAVTLSRVSYGVKSEREKHINAYMNLENGIDDLICKAEIDTDIENKYMDTKG